MLFRSVKITVEDTGIGIPMDKQASIFEKFVQVDGSSKRKYGGTGLGLAICRRLVECMGGDIGVVSRLNEGSRFWFTIPLPVAASKITLPVTSVVLSGVRVLIVCEDDLNRAALSEELLGCGIRNETAASVAEGDRKSTRLNSSHTDISRMPSSA